MPWLMKAEPDSRIVKGKDVKFSVDDFEEIGTSPWDGVRSHEAKNIMKEKMKLGDLVLFCHSNCKMPGVFALAEVAKEGYPDYTAWDASHPYYDPKSSEDSPTWYMVSVRFIRRLPHPVTLSFIKSLVGLSAPPEEISYIGSNGLKAIQSMALVNRGRLSVQPVESDAYDAIVQLGDKGGWEEVKKGKSDAKRKAEEVVTESKKPKSEAKAGDTKSKTEAKAEDSSTSKFDQAKSELDENKVKRQAKPKAEPKPKPVVEGTRRSARIRK